MKNSLDFETQSKLNQNDKENRFNSTAPVIGTTNQQANSNSKNTQSFKAGTGVEVVKSQGISDQGEEILGLHNEEKKFQGSVELEEEEYYDEEDDGESRKQDQDGDQDGESAYKISRKDAFSDTQSYKTHELAQIK